MRLAAVALLLALAAPHPDPAEPPVAARAYVLVEGRTGQVLAERNAHLAWPPASTTKILTALLVAESLPLDRVVVTSGRAAAQREGASVGLRPGERRRVRDLFYAMLLTSANDAALALAEAAAGSVEAFVARMNQRARELGARNSHFTNPHGLYHPQHRSTAYDLALLARAALANPQVAQAVASRAYDYPTEAGVRRLVNRNRLLATYPGADGVKTGWLAESGPCLVASARRGARTLIAVVLDSTRVFDDAAALLDFGFEAYELRVLARPQDPVAEVRLSGGVRLRATVRQELALSVPRGARVALQPRWEQNLKPPVAAGQPVGWLEVLVGGRLHTREVLVASHPVDREPPAPWVPRWLWERVGGR